MKRTPIIPIKIQGVFTKDVQRSWKCRACGRRIREMNPKVCPYCGSSNIHLVFVDERIRHLGRKLSTPIYRVAYPVRHKIRESIKKRKRKKKIEDSKVYESAYEVPGVFEVERR